MEAISKTASSCSSPTNSLASNPTTGLPSTAAAAGAATSSGSGITEASLMFDIQKLNYDIHRYSSFSTNYFPENILIDCPSDQSSRWSAHTNQPPQYLTLKLRRPAIVKTIKFGKFEKSHVCNLKKFRIYGGLDEERMALLMEGGLKNDNQPEVFNLRCLTENGCEHFPIIYLKIVPLLSWGPTFNFSIWYIELQGQDDPMYTSASMKNYNMLREVEIVKLCLKHFRQQGYENAFNALQQQTQIQLEHPLISDLHKCLVVDGDFEKAEQFISEAISDGLMDEYLNRQDYRHSWRMQQTNNDEDLQPGTRGGHQLIMDTNKHLVYLYGGWDGYQDLSDLWVYDIEKNSWSMLFAQSEQHNGPTPRSCHKMVFDPVSKNIFMLGRYLDNSIRTTEYIKSDFFLYDTCGGTWLQICDDTSQVGGPQLVYDHQMCIDADKRNIYVFGGKILTPRSVSAGTSNEPEYSGLFSYHIATNTWTQILVDCHHPSASKSEVLSIKSRFTHCMVFHNKQRKLYIYGGQRGKEDIDEFISYDVDTQVISLLNKDYQSSCGGAAAGGVGAHGSSCSTASGINAPKNEPSPGYTLRASIDCERNEIYIFSSLSKLKDRRDVHQVDAFNSFWVYSLQEHKWSRIYTYRHNIVGDASSQQHMQQQQKLISTASDAEPCPRYAHQLVYDDAAKLHYLFGGNPGSPSLPQLRLDDFWILSLQKPQREEIFKHCRYLIRKQHYEEMARTDPLRATQFLRKHIAEAIDHSNKEQLSNFHKLASLLFKPEGAPLDAMITPSLDNKTAAEIEQKSQATQVEEDHLTSDNTAAGEDLSLDSCATNATNTSSASSTDCSTGGKRPRHDYLHEIKSRRAFLFNKLVQLMPSHMVQPERNLSDFVIM